MIMNIDETFLELAFAKAKVLVASSKKWGIRGQADTSQHITAVVCIAADGTALPILIILPLVKLPADIKKEDYPMFQFDFQTNGWIDCGIFEKYCKETLIPEFKRRRAELEKQGIMNARGLLYVDGHASRNNKDLMKEFEEAGIDVQCLVAHTSHICQPLDLVVYSVFKKFFRDLLVIHSHMSASEVRRVILKAADEAFDKTLKPRCYIVKSFDRSGLYVKGKGVDESRILQNPNVTVSPPTPTTPPLPAPATRKGPPSLSGLTLTSAETIDTLLPRKEKPVKIRKNAKKTASAAPAAPSPTPVEQNTAKTVSRKRKPKKRTSSEITPEAEIVTSEREAQLLTCAGEHAHESYATENWYHCWECEFHVCSECNFGTPIVSEHNAEVHPDVRFPKRPCRRPLYY